MLLCGVGARPRTCLQITLTIVYILYVYAFLCILVCRNYGAVVCYLQSASVRDAQCSASLQLLADEYGAVRIPSCELPVRDGCFVLIPGVGSVEAGVQVQVEHFDKLQHADVQLVRKLHQNINDNHTRAKGVEAGKPLG